MKFQLKLFNKVIYLILKTGIIDFNNSVLAIDSHQINATGKKFSGGHYVYLDYDNKYPSEIEDFIKKYGFMRFLIIKSSKDKFHAISFTRIEYNELCNMLSTLKGYDKRHFQHLLKDGFNSLRFTIRKGNLPEIVKTIDNVNGYRYYDHEVEKIYKEVLLNGNVLV